jgi:hypothetical protein
MPWTKKELWFHSLQWQETFLFYEASIQAFGPTHRPHQQVPAEKQSGYDANHTPSSSANVKNERNYTSSSRKPTFLTKKQLYAVNIIPINGAYTKFV